MWWRVGECLTETLVESWDELSIRIPESSADVAWSSPLELPKRLLGWVCTASILSASIGLEIWAVGVCDVSGGIIQVSDDWLWAKVTDGGAGIEWEPDSIEEWKLIVWTLLDLLSTLLSIRSDWGFHWANGGAVDSVLCRFATLNCSVPVAVH